MTDPTTANEPQMVQCEVTGEMVPEDETVVLAGKRVSARGKQLLLDKMRTGESLPGELEAPGSLRRFGCAILDAIVLWVAGMAVGLIGGFLMVSSGIVDVRMQGVMQILGTAIGVLYFTLMHAHNGQTLGKMAGKIRAVKLDGSKMSPNQALIRALAFTGISLIPAAALIIGGDLVLPAILILSLLTAGYGLANAITVLVSHNKRALHDMIAGTRVIMLEG